MSVAQFSEKAQASLKKVIAQFQSGDLSPVTDIVKIRRHADDTVPAHDWSLANQVLAFIQAGGELDCRGFRQWQLVERKVRKGARAVYILGPVTRKVEDESSDEPRTIVLGFRSIPVFPLHATEGKPLPQFDYAPATLPPLYEVAERLGVSVSYGPIESAVGGWYAPGSKHIHLGAHNVSLFFHELAHAAHDTVESLQGGQDAEQETVAELTAAVLADLYGYDHTGDAWRYIQHYATEPLTAIYKALSAVDRVLAVILDDG